MFTNTHDLGPDFNIINTHMGFIHRYKIGGIPASPVKNKIQLTGCYNGLAKGGKKPPNHYAHPHVLRLL